MSSILLKKITVTLTLLALLLPTFSYASRVYTLGAEEGAITDLAGIVLGSNAMPYNTSIKRSGNASYKNPTFVNNSQTGNRYTSFTFGTDPGFIRFYLYIETLPNSNSTILTIQQSTSARADITLTTTGTLRIAGDNQVQVGSDSAPLSLGQWYRIETKFDFVDGTNDFMEAKIDGTVFASSSAIGLATQPDGFYIGANLDGNTDNATSGSWYFDDIAMNDSTPCGCTQTDYPGPGNVVHFYPNANGDFTEGSGQDAGTTNGYTYIDDSPKDDDTTYWQLQTDVSANSGSADRLDVNLPSSSSLGIGSTDTVTLVHVHGWMRPATAATASWVPRIKSASGATVSEGTIVQSLAAAWNLNDDGSNKAPRLTSYTDPTTGVAWTPTGTNSLDNMQIGARAPDGNPDMWITSLFAIVEYVAAPPAPPGARAKFFIKNGFLKAVNGFFKIQ